MLRLRCIWANKAALAGYLLIALFLLSIALVLAGVVAEPWTFAFLLLFFGGLILHIKTDSGADTFRHYNRTLAFLKNGVLTPEKIKTKIARHPYCFRCAEHMALQDFAKMQATGGST